MFNFTPFMPMAQLGAYTFALDTAAFQSLQRQTEYRWQAQSRIGREPAQQFLGVGDDTIQLAGVVYPAFRGGLGQVGDMRAQAALGVPLPLIYAVESVGQYAGLWVIKSISEERTVFFSDGTPRRIEFRVSLASYGEDKATKRAEQGDKSATDKAPSKKNRPSVKSAVRKAIKRIG